MKMASNLIIDTFLFYIFGQNYTKMISNMADSEDQIQYFNAIIMWLMKLHAPLCRYIISTDVNPWFTFDVEKAMIEENIANRVWKRRKTTADRTRYKKQRRQVNYLMRLKAVYKAFSRPKSACQETMEELR
jgi:hypothetical protein